MEHSTFIQFHDHNIPLPFLKTINNYSFGILKVNIQQNKKKEQKENIKPQHFIFTIDTSKSMDYRCRDKKTKLDHIKFTLENMLLMLANIEINISIQINTFNNDAKTYIPITQVNQENISDLIEKINNIKSYGSTNLEDALKLAKQDILDYKEQHPFHNINHILLTDGVPTKNATDHHILKEYILEDYSNIFLGYGSDHDPILLGGLTNYIHGSYFFIDALEKASFVYGEIIHNIMNTLMEDVIYSLKNAELYNYVTNTWVTELKEGQIINGLEKIFQIRSTNPINAQCSITGTIHEKTLITIYAYPYLNKKQENLTVYAFRQKTQELLFEAKQYSLLSNPKPNYIFTNNYFTNKNRKEPTLKQTIYDFLQFVIKYRKENDLEQDKFTKMLCDDLFISYKTIGTDRCSIYTAARQTSQGRQTTYHVSLEYSDNDSNDSDSNDDESIFPYILSDHIDSPYATENVLTTMLQCSQKYEYDHNEKTVIL